MEDKKLHVQTTGWNRMCEKCKKGYHAPVTLGDVKCNHCIGYTKYSRSENKFLHRSVSHA